MEPCKNYVLNCIQALLGLEKQPEKLATSNLLDNLLYRPEKKSLTLQYQQGKGLKVYNPNASESLGDDVRLIGISKVGVDVLTEDNYQKHLTIQLINGGNSVADLLAQLSNLYIPVTGTISDENLKKTLLNLRSQLEGSGSQLQADFDDDDVTRVTKPSEEFEYWIRVATSHRSTDLEQKKATQINQVFSKIQPMWKDTKNLEFNGLKDLLTQTLDVLDELWTSAFNYPERRFTNLIICLQRAVTSKLENSFKNGQTIFTTSAPPNIKLKLAEAHKLVDSFSKELNQFIGYWKTSNRPMKIDIDLSEISDCIKRASDIIELRNTMEEIMKVQDLRLDVDTAFSELSEINPFIGVSKNSGKSQQWQSAVQKVQIEIDQIEPDLIKFLRTEVFNQQLIRQNPIQIIREMQRWSGLLSRHGIQKQFQEDREQVVLSMIGMTDRLREEFSNRSGAALLDGEDQLPYTVNFSKTLHLIIWSKSIMGKVRKILSMAQSLFADVKKAQSLFQTCQQIADETQQFEQEQFDSWRSSILGILKNPDNELALQITGKLMEIDIKDGDLKVNYSEKLVHLIKEVRQLCELGYRKQIPKQIIEITEIGKKYYKEALTLKQVASFYNQMSDQIVECQKPMLVELAINFENIVKNMKLQPKNKKVGGSITWDNAEELENYISKIQDSANAIMSESKRLRRIHNDILELVVQLFDIDLVKRGEDWRKQMNKIRSKIEEGCNNKDPKLCSNWKKHWDFQIFKALEFQYQKGFSQLEKTINEIQADVVVRGGSILFKPPVEELREKYYQEIKNFIAYPVVQFQGVGGSSEVYKTMPERNAQFLNVVYQHAEGVFEKLDAILLEFNQWSIVATLDPDMIQGLLPNLEAWEGFLKEVRFRRKELDKIHDLRKVDCFTINLGTFKSQIDTALTKLVDNMMAELRNQIKTDCEEIDAFLIEAQQKLAKKPTTMQEMTDAQSKYMELKASKFEMGKKLTEGNSKCKLVMSLSSSAASASQNPILQQLQNVQKQWENFEVLIGDYDFILSEQTKQIKQDMQLRSKELESEMDKFYSRYQAMRPKQVTYLDKEQANEMAENMRGWRQQWKEIEDKVNLLLTDHDHFEMKRPQFSQLQTIQQDLQQQEQGWQVYDEFMLKVNELGKEDWLAYRSKLYTFQELLTQQQESVRNPKNDKKDPVVAFVTHQIELFMKIYPLLKLMVGEAYEAEHWNDLFIMLQMKDMKRDKLLFNDLLKQDALILKKSNEIKELAARAVGEITLREAILELKTWCDSAEFELTDYTNNNRTTPLIREWKDLMTKVSDNQSLLSSLKESKFVKRFSDQVESFEFKLGGIDEYLSKLNIIQRKWVYLEPIFLRGALPSEQGRFKRLDDDYRSIMLNLQRDPKVVSLCGVPGIKDTLETLLDQLERCQKALNDFLEEKRGKFPRFYFLGDDDLLEILGQSQNPQVIQMHLKKLFAGINTVEFNKDASQIFSMISSAKEVVRLNESIQVDEVVETWLSQLSNQMQVTLQDSLKSCLKEKSLELGKYSSQVLCVCEEIKFTESAVQAIRSQTLSKCKSDLLKLLDNFTSLNGQSAGNILVQLKLKALILDLIHHVDVVDQMIANNVTQFTDWYWSKQLRFEFNGIAQILMVKARFDYTYEYQGNAGKLVHTPLTDKCYLTLTQGMSMGYGGNPYGPAGTGKTESVKALGQLFGRQVLVFNCDEGIDFKSMGRIFIGLVKCGAWGCFDEFNRLLEEQLSAISQQIQIIQHAIKENAPQMQLLGNIVNVNKNSGIFVTLNPAGKQYGGRSKLPDNLKQLFRPVAMSVPDNELIAEVLLYSEGFKAAKELAEKVITIFTLSRQLLSPQQHYDWGLRALKTILTVAGQIIQEERKSGREVTADIEAELLIKAIRINTMSKLTFYDTRKFVALVNDVFPGIKSKDIAYDELSAALKEVLTQMNLHLIDNQVTKILQFYEATKQRMGVVLVGPSGCGKTTIWKVLKKAHEKMGVVVKTHIMNPKSMPRSQLLGNMNNDTREFTEGVLTASARQVVKEPSEVLNWIICDGDIDPEWIESLNSVLDDNHLLTLPTGERISFGTNVNFIFETSDLQYASPATVSRMGMIFLNNEDISVDSLISRYIKKMDCSEEIKSKINDWITSYFTPLKDFVNTIEDSQVVSTTRIGLILNVLSQIQRIPQNKQQFNFYMLLGLSSNFTNDIRSQIARQVFQTLGDKHPSDLSKSPLDYSVDDNYQKYNHLSTVLDESQFNDLDEPPVIMTIGHQRDLQVIKSWIDNCEPFIIVGKEGVGKNLLIRSAFDKLRQSVKIQIATIHCNAQTSASQIIQKLNQVCSKGTSALGRVLKPKECSRLVLYLKDINLPKPDKYQTIQLIAFLQQLITHRGFYDDNLEFVYLDDKIQIVASMNPPSTVGRHPLSTRFTANVRIHYIDPPTTEELQIIYTEYLRSAIFSSKKMGSQMNSSDALVNAKKSAQMLVECYQTITSKFSVDDQRHYLFTPRNMTHIVFGLMRYHNLLASPETIMESLQNELNKNFRDRLVSLEECSRFDNLMMGLFKSIFKAAPSGQAYFGTAVNLYQLSRLDKKDFRNLVQQAIQRYSREHKEIQLYLIDETLSLMSSLNRSLSSQSSTSILLAGRSGIGRKICVSVMCTMLNQDLLIPYTSRDYSLREFKKDLKLYLEQAGAQNKQCVLFLEDHVLLQNPSILETVNSLIASGQVAGLFTQDEVERSIQHPEELRQEYYGKSLYEAFFERCKKNLKVVLSMDHTNKEFGLNCAANPALFTKCTIVWLPNLSRESMSVFINEELKEVVLHSFKEKEREDFISQAISMHRIGVDNGASPRTFFALLQSYRLIYTRKLASRGSQASHLKTGLAKLTEAKQLVDQLTNEAQEKRKLLSIKQKEADQALVQIQNAMNAAAERKTETQQLQSYLQEEEGKINISKQKVENELASVKPLIEEAKKAVNGINKSNLDELRALKMPPDAIINVLTAVLRLFKQSDTKWASMRNFLSQRGVIEQIIDFDPHNITPDIRRDVEDQINKYSSSFEKQVIYRASVAAGPLAEWVLAVLKYSTVLEKIAPLENELGKLYKKLEASRNRLRKCQDELVQLDNQVQQLRDDFSHKTGEAESLKQGLKKAEDTVNIAKNLLVKLADENTRWQQQQETILQELRQFPIDSLISAAYTVYLSHTDENIRAMALIEWRKLIKNDKFDYIKFMSTESQQLKAKAQGLPGDQLSIENSIILQNSSKPPLLIDPNTQASEWLKVFLQSSGVEALSQQDPKFQNQLELSVRFGKTLLIQELDSVEGLLVPLLRGDLIHQGPRWVVMIGDKAIDYNENFNLFLCTRNSAIYLPPHTESLVQVVNFTVTKSGLEGKLLSIIINIEQPELEEKKQKLLENEESLKVQLSDLERILLEELATSTGNILENKQLIDSLNQTKSKSSTIQKSLQESSELQQSLDRQREVYRSLAQRGATLFILISDLQKVNNMYRYSLAYYVKIFKKSLDIQVAFDTTEQKLEHAATNLYKNVFNQIASSLFKSDRLMFALHLVKGIKQDLFDISEWDFFLGNIATIDSRQQLPKWASADRKEMFNSYMQSFSKQTAQINFNDKEWEQWALNGECEKNFPPLYKSKLSSFQRVLIVYVFRPERIQSALSSFVCENLALTSASGQNFSFKSILQNEISSEVPCLFVVSAGSDPSVELQEFASQEVGINNFQELSMGGNQNELALQMLKEASAKGQWLCLKNLHLVISFLPILEKTFKSLQSHPNFRLWLTTEAHTKFPSILLETCFKVSYESPPGLKKNLVRIIQSWPSNYLTTGNTQRAQLLFILAWFHALLQERRTYIPQGWSKFYEFSYGDQRAGAEVIESLMSESQINWPTLYGLYENAIYGGRIDNEQDLRVLRAYLNTYFTNEMLKGGKLPNGGQIPTTNQFKDYQLVVNKCAEQDNPSYFGLPMNIDKAVQRYAIQGVLLSLKSMNSIVGEELKFEKEKWSQILNPLINMWGQLSKVVKDGGQVLQITAKQLATDEPIDSFIFLEAQQAHQQFEKIDQVFEQLKNILFSNGLLTSEIIDMGLTFMKDQVPSKWTNLWEGPDSIAMWLKGFCKKISALKQWIERTNSKNLLGETLDLGELFHPEVFMNALRQKTARKINQPLNLLKLQVDFDSVKLKSPLIVKLSGLLLQGCGFQNNTVVDASANLQEFTQLPVLHITYVPKSSPDVYPKDQTAEFPIFLNAQREKMLTRVTLLNQGSVNERVIAGVALFLSQND